MNGEVIRNILIGKAMGGGGTATASGSVASFSTNKAAPLSLTAQIVPVQDLHGYDNPWPAGGGKNLIDGTPYKGQANQVWIGSDNGSRIYFPLSAGTYTISFTRPTNKSFGVYALSKVGQSQITILSASATQTKSTFTISSDDEYTFWIYNNSTDIAISDVDKVMVESGSTATSYFPYSNICPISGFTGANIRHSGADTSDYTTIPVTWTSEGTVYGGNLAIGADGSCKLTVTMASVDLGTLTWVSMSASRFTTTAVLSGAKAPENNNATTTVCAEKYKSAAINTFTTSGVCVGINMYGYVVCRTGSEDTPTGQLVYELATPIEYTLTSITPITTLKGVNNLWADTGDVAVEYRTGGGTKNLMLMLALAGYYND